jgi:hypothetical protein
MPAEMEESIEQQIAYFRKTIDQLRVESSIDRRKVSEVAKDIIEFCESGLKEDPMLTPVCGTDNPFLSANKTCQCNLQ